MLPDGRAFEAGLVEITSRQASSKCAGSNTVSNSVTPIPFQNSYSSAPAFISTIQTAKNEAGNLPSSYSSPWLAVACKTLTASSASVALESGETTNHGSVTQAESIGYVVMEIGSGAFTQYSSEVFYTAMLTDKVVKGYDNSPAATVSFADVTSASPLIVGGMITRNGGDGGWLRLSDATSTSASLFIEEDQNCDTERKHTTEKASLIIWSGLVDLPPTTTTTTTTQAFATLELREASLAKKTDSIESETISYGFNRFWLCEVHAKPQVNWRSNIQATHPAPARRSRFTLLSGWTLCSPHPSPRRLWSLSRRPAQLGPRPPQGRPGVQLNVFCTAFPLCCVILAGFLLVNLQNSL